MYPKGGFPGSRGRESEIIAELQSSSPEADVVNHCRVSRGCLWARSFACSIVVSCAICGARIVAKAALHDPQSR